MSDPVLRTKAEVEAAVMEIVAKRITDEFLPEVSKPGNLDWLVKLIDHAFDRVDGKTKRVPEAYIRT